MNIRLILAAVVAMVAAPVMAASVTYTFSQGGYSEGAAVTGYFTGEDLDMNGQLSSFGIGSLAEGGDFGEITDFSMTFSGNSLVDTFTLGFADLFGLVYTLDGGPLGDDDSGDGEGIGATGFEVEYLAGGGPLSGACDGIVVCGTVAVFTEGPGGYDETMELVQLSPVPVPAALPLMMFALGALRFMRRRA